MADVKFRVVRVALTTAAVSSTQDITIAGFGTPAAAIFLISNAQTDDTIQGQGLLGYGFTDGTNQAQAVIQSADGNATSNVSRMFRDDSIASLLSESGSAETARWAFDSWITDGVRISVVDQAPVAAFATVILIGGADVTDAHVGHTILNNTGETDITAPGFEPDMVFMHSAGMGGAAPNGPTSHATLSFGVGLNDGLATQRAIMLSSWDGSAAADVSATISNTYVVGQVFDDVFEWGAELGNFDANGFSLTANNATEQDNVAHLALKFANMPDLALFDMQWPAAGDYAETAPGFLPDFGLIASLGNATARDSGIGSDVWGVSFAAFDEAGIVTQTSTDFNAADPTVAKSLSADRLRILDPDGVTDSVVASGYAFDTEGWDFPLATNPSSAVLGWGLAVGPAVVLPDSVVGVTWFNPGAGTTTTPTVDKHPNTLEGDYQLAVVGGYGTNNDPQITPPAGWTLVRDDTQSGLGSLAYEHVAGPSEPDDYTWTFDLAKHPMVVLHTFRGANWGLQDHAGAIGNSDSPQSPSADALTANAVGLYYSTVFESDPISYTPPPGMDETFDQFTTNRALMTALEQLDSAGATGTRTATTDAGVWAAAYFVVGPLQAFNPAWARNSNQVIGQ